MQSNNGLYKVNIFDPETEEWVRRREPCTLSNWRKDPFGAQLRSELESLPQVERAFPGTRAIAFGHLGDGNVHFNVRAPAGASGSTPTSATIRGGFVVTEPAAVLGGRAVLVTGPGLRCGTVLPVRALWPFDPAAPAKLRRALEHLGQAR